MQRRLAAVLVADVVGYSRLMEADEAGTFSALNARRKNILEPAVKAHSGRIVKLMGDGVLVEFASAVNALACALSVQEGMISANAGVEADRQVWLRIGLSLGEVIGEGSDIFGKGVNVAARLETLADPGGICISGKLREEVRGRISAEFDDLGNRVLKNMKQPVRVFRVTQRRTGAAGPTAQTLTIRAGRTPGHSIAVLSLDNMSSDPAQQYLSDGITEDIITELSRFRGLTVMARHASAQFDVKGTTIAEVHRVLGVDYVVEGSVRKVGGRLRVTVQLIDATNGNHVWAERFDRQEDDIYAILDEVVGAIAAAVEDRLTTAAAAQARKRPTESWSAYDYLLQGRELCNSHREPESIPNFEQAVAIDPAFAQAHAWLGLAQAVSFTFSFDPEVLDRAIGSGQRALALDATEATGHWACAMALTWKRQLDAAGRHFERAVSLNPADLQIRADRANLLRYQGLPEDALAAVEGSLRQGPFSPGWYHVARGEALFDLRRYGEAIDALENLPAKSALAWAYLVAAHGYNSDPATSARALSAARLARPALNARTIAAVEPYAAGQALDHLLEGLRRAGLES